MYKPNPTEKVASVEQLLFDTVERLNRNAVDRRAVVLHLSRLKPDNRGANRLRIAANTFEALVKPFDGKIFVLHQGDIVFICKEENAAAVDAAVRKVRYLFGDDPLAVQIEDDADAFATWDRLGGETGTFNAYVAEIRQEDERRRGRAATIAAGGAAPTERQPMDPAGLTELINAIVRADLSNLLRRQAVCSLGPDRVPHSLFRELYVSIADLRDAIMPKRDIASDRWLFQYLTHTLDKRVLALLRKADDSTLAHSYSLNLNVATLLSPEFLTFDQNLRANTRGSIVIEIEKVEIFADIGAYLFARDFVRERGYRLCLDGMTRLTLPFIDRARLGLDLVKLFWSADMAEGGDKERNREFTAALDRVGKGRIILARCDTEQAIDFGLTAGLKLFQGRIIEKMLSASAAPILTRNRLSAPAPVGR